jgi:hypothetical protein
MMIPTVYTSEGWYELKGRGRVACVYFNGTPEVWNPEVLMNLEVIIDDEVYVVKGLDLYRHMISPDRPYRATIGILV